MEVIICLAPIPVLGGHGIRIVATDPIIVYIPSHFRIISMAAANINL